MTVPFSHGTSSEFHDSLQDQPRKGVVYTRHDTVELCLNIARRNLPLPASWGTRSGHRVRIWAIQRTGCRGDPPGSLRRREEARC